MFFIAPSVSPKSTTRFVVRMEDRRFAVPDPGSAHHLVDRPSRISWSLSSGRPTGSGLRPTRWQAPAGPGGTIRAALPEPHPLRPRRRPLAADHGGDREQPLFAGPL